VWNSLGCLLVDKLQRFEEAEAAFRKAAELDPSDSCILSNLARTLAQLKRPEEATECYRKSIEVSDDSDQNLRLQAQLWLSNQDLALQALETLAQRASSGTDNAFFQLKEQCFESRFAEFLQPFALALRVASGETDAMLDVAVEVRAVTEDVLAQIKGKRA
jgi:tetratricopeptide (TPR) repeat protein